MTKLLAVFVVFTGFQSAFAKFPVSSIAQEARLHETKQLFRDFALSSVLAPVIKVNSRCGGSGSIGECVSYLSERTGYSSSGKLVEFAEACRGNRGAGCIQFLSEKTGYTSSGKLIEFAQACRGAGDGGCAKYISERTGYTSSGKLIEFLEACRGNEDDSCVRFMSEKSGYTSSGKLIEFAQTCGGRSGH